jgi:hypothetical protein
MEDFLDASGLLEGVGGSVPVASPEDLARRVIHLFRNPGELKKRGMKAREAVRRHRGAAEAHARVIAKLVSSGKTKG